MRLDAFAILVSMFAALPAQELLPDGGFETGTVVPCQQGGLPAPWVQASNTVPGADTWVVDCVASGGLQIDQWSHFPPAFTPHSGQRFAAGWSAANEAFATPLANNPVPGSVYRLSGWFVASLTHSGHSGYDVFLSSSPFRLTGYYVGAIGTSATTSVWTQHFLDFLAPPNVRYLVLDPRSDDNNYTGADDLSLQPSPAGNGRFIGYGNALAGSNGLPVLAGSGTIAPGQTITLTMTGGLANALGVQVVGFLPGYLSVLGGVMVPNPDAVFVTVTDGNGAMSLSATWPSLPLMLGAYFQFGVFDPAAVQGVSMSNALQAIQ